MLLIHYRKLLIRESALFEGIYNKPHTIEKDDVVKILAREEGDRVLDIGHRVRVEQHRDKERLSLRSLDEKNLDINREKTMRKTAQKIIEKDFEIEL